MAHEAAGRGVGLLPEAGDGSPSLLAWFISGTCSTGHHTEKNSKIFRMVKRFLKDFPLSKNPYILVEVCRVFIMTQITLFSPPQLSLLCPPFGSSIGCSVLNIVLLGTGLNLNKSLKVVIYYVCARYDIHWSHDGTIFEVCNNRHF